MFRACPSCGRAVVVPGNRPVRCPACSASVTPDARDGGSGRDEAQQAQEERAPTAVTTDEAPASQPPQSTFLAELVDRMDPVPWDDPERPLAARAAGTLVHLSLDPVGFFRRMAADRDAGATPLALVSITGFALGLAWFMGSAFVRAGSSLSPTLILLELTALNVAFIVLFAVIQVAASAVLLSSRGSSLKTLRRSAAFAAVPLFWGVVPVLGTVLGAGLSLRAYVVALRLRHRLSARKAWALALLPTWGLAAAALAVVVTIALLL